VSEDHHSVVHFRDWLRKGMTRCAFASSIAGEGQINYAILLDELTEADVPQLDGFLASSMPPALNRSLPSCSSRVCERRAGSFVCCERSRLVRDGTSRASTGAGTRAMAPGSSA
jgi:hypothetical protein